MDHFRASLPKWVLTPQMETNSHIFKVAIWIWKKWKMIKNAGLVLRPTTVDSEDVFQYFHMQNENVGDLFKTTILQKPKSYSLSQVQT